MSNPQQKNNTSTPMTFTSFETMKRRRSQITIASVAASALLSTASAQDAFPAEHHCPAELNGWAPSADCTKYYWCNGGSLASMPYDCVSGTLFDSVQLTCLPADGVECEIRTTTTTTTEAYVWTETPTAWASRAPSPAAEITQLSAVLPTPASAPVTPFPSSTPTTRSPTVPPTPRFTYIGDAIYFPDFPARSCSTANPSPWLKPDELFTTKEECCSTVMNWIPLEDCLGLDWIETNYYWNPTRAPTLSPSARPSTSPSASPSASPTRSPSETPTISPSSSEPTEGPSMTPTLSPNDSPTAFPSASPTLSPTEFESEAPTTTPTIDPKVVLSMQLNSASKVQDSYLVDLIGWANDGMETYSTQDFSLGGHNSYSFSITDEPTPSPIMSSHYSQVSELILPVTDDATISRQRPNVNFGEHQALAVDGGDLTTTKGDSNGESFDSLLKFDVSLIDPERAVDSLLLKMYVVEGCKWGGTFVATSDSSWQSSTITWDSAPVADGEVIARLPSITSSQWVDVDVTKALSWHDAASAFADPYISIRIESDENSRCLYSSMESGDALSPRIVVRYMEQATVVERSEPYQEQALADLPPPVIGDFLLLKATDDATVVGSNPSRNFGSEPNLLVAFDTYTRDILDSLIRFDLTEMVLTPARTAVLSLYSETDCDSAGSFSTIYGNTNWSEDHVTWASAPIYEPGSQDGTSLGVFGAVRANEWNAFNVLPAINAAIKQKKNSLTFRISSGNLQPCQFTSRNGGRAPKLMVAF